MSVQLVLCVADSVWRAAGHLARVCCMPMAHLRRHDHSRPHLRIKPTAVPAHWRIAPAQVLLLLLAVL